MLPKVNNLELVLADVTGGVDMLGNAIAGSHAVILATGFRPSIDLTALWKVDNTGTKNMVDACQQRGIKRLVLDTLFGGSASRDIVAKVAVESLSIPEASFKVVELISQPDAPPKSIQELFVNLS